MSLLNQIESLDKLNNDKIKQELNEQDIQNYLELKSNVKNVREVVDSAEYDLQQCLDLTDHLRQEVSLDENKSKAAETLRNIGELKARSLILENKLKLANDPQKEQENLNDVIKSGNSAINSMTENLENLEKQMEEQISIYNNKENDLENLTSPTGTELKQLIKKQNQLNNMLADWQANEGSEKSEIASLEAKYSNFNDQVKRLKEGIKRLPELGDQNILESATNANKSGSKLQEEITQILILEKKLENESEELEEKLSKTKADISTFTDVATVKADCEEKRLALTTERESLNHQRNIFQQATEAKTRKMQRLSNLLENDSKFMQVSRLEGEVKKLSEKNFELFEIIEQRQFDAMPLRNKVKQLEQDHQEWLQQRLLNGLGVQLE